MFSVWWHHRFKVKWHVERVFFIAWICQNCAFINKYFFKTWVNPWLRVPADQLQNDENRQTFSSKLLKLHMSTRGSSSFLLSLASVWNENPQWEKTFDQWKLLLCWSARSRWPPLHFLPRQKKTVDACFFWLMSQRYYFNILCWRRRFLSRKFLCQVALTRCCQLVRSPPSTSCFCSSLTPLAGTEVEPALMWDNLPEDCWSASRWGSDTSV